MKSRDWLALLPSGFGKAVPIPAPWVSATRATDNDPRASRGIMAGSGSITVERPLGILAISRTSSTDGRRSRFTTTEARTKVITAAAFSVTGIFLKTIMAIIVLNPTTVVAGSHCPT